MSYQQLYQTMSINPAKLSQLDKVISKINANKGRYTAVWNLTSVPWQVIAAIHYRESGNSFLRHLHNGDPLTARTTHVPAGRPLKGTPPFTWEESAIDAIRMQGLNKVTDWSIGNTMVLLEKYNGLGYKKKGLPSPYLWSWTDKYKAGKYVADGKFDPKVVDVQCGVAVILKKLLY
jgi:lysozyme family protein